MLRLIRSPGTEPAGAGQARSEAVDPLRAVAMAAGQGQREAQRTLLVAAGPAMLRAIRGVLGSAPQEVEDTLQEAMVALHLAIGGFRGECTTLHFACRIAVQTAMNARRRAGYRQRVTPSMPPEALDATAGRAESAHALVAAAQRREGLRQLLCELPEAQAEVLAFHSMLGHTIEETAVALGAPIDTIRSRLRNALSKLRARVAADAQLSELLAPEGGL
jgi:RNA polymerase sigma-70 factor (ECF subfamily)